MTNNKRNTLFSCVWIIHYKLKYISPLLVVVVEKSCWTPVTETFTSPASFQQSFLSADFCYPITLILLNAHEDKMAAG